MRKSMNGNQKDRYRMRIQTTFYFYYQRLVQRFRMRFIYLDRLDATNPYLLQNRLTKKQKWLLFEICEVLDQERSI